ncbi:DNA polymerase family B-domain-containing protein [Pelagophyceae sp. CCMP2097]|nr:DNA polymerase family B-domain-containing protein [Pelagophyceae sp. CCMP2097]
MERTKRAASARRTNRSKDLEALREARGGGGERQWAVPEEKDVYDNVDEAGYRGIVAERRQREDFVVDDDGLGYYDDGEEHLGEDEASAAEKAELKRSAKKVDRLHSDKALKKARKLNSSGTGTDDAEAETQPQMWKYLGAPSAVPKAQKPAQKMASNFASLESLIDGVGHDVQTPRLGSRSAQPPSSYTSHSALERAQLPSYSGRKSLAEPRRFWEDAPSAAVENDAFFEMGLGPAHDAPKRRAPAPVDDAYAAYDEGPAYAFPTDDAGPMGMGMAAAARPASANPAEARPEAPAKRVATSRFSRTAISAPVSEAALRVLDAKVEEAEEIPAESKVEESVPPPPEWQASVLEDDEPAAAPPSASPDDVLPKEKWLRHDDDEAQTGEHLWMYCLDVHEQNGVVYMMGKVQLEDGSGHVSACVVVQSVERSFFVLPREKRGNDGIQQRCDMGAVYAEVKSLLVPQCVPRVEGDILKCRPVQRAYAFGDSTIPRDCKTEYLKVKYAAKYRAPDAESCTEGGRTFERILGAGASPLELFILKRKLMGPCWVRVDSPKVQTAKVSWCVLEVSVAEAKAVTVLHASESVILRPAPPLVTTTIEIKTAVNPRSNQHEIIAIAALTHRGVTLDKATPEGSCQAVFSPQKKTAARDRRWTCIAVRALGPDIAAASTNGASSRLPRDLLPELRKVGCLGVAQCVLNEKALLSTFLSRLHADDPDVLVGHNMSGFTLDMLLCRTLDLKLGPTMWSKLGRLRRSKPPHNWKGQSGRFTFHASATCGRLIADTYAFAKEHVSKVTNYTLSNLVEKQLGVSGRNNIEPHQLPDHFASTLGIVSVLRHACEGARLTERLMLKLQLLPLSKQLTCISGNLLSSTLKGNRAGRIEYLLLHEFHRLKYISPEKVRFEESGSGKRKARTTGRQKAGYAGGLVLEPKKGFYDTHVLLLDFNSLYPSIIQEYDVCFTTISDWPKFLKESGPSSKKARMDDADEEDEDADEADAVELPSPPTATGGAPKGVLPRVLKTLIARRKEVKQLLKSEKDPALRETYNIRQLALKLTANSMYGCLGFQHSRFFAQPLAALVTSLGRETLQQTADLVPREFDLEVIYGDTDSIMINTRSDDLEVVRKIGADVKRAVNKKYKLLELEVDGIFKRMVLYKKKKYAAVVVTELPGGGVVLETETKGIDHVRRDWCELSKRTGRYVLDRLLSGDASEAVVADIHAKLEEVSQAMRAGKYSLRDYVITKGLNKPVEKYPDAKAQAHLKVAKAMLAQGRPVNVGDHIPYVICKGDAKAASERAFHPDDCDVSKPVEELVAPVTPGGNEETEEDLLAKKKKERPCVDIDWYLAQQILPPIERLCEPIASTSRATLAQKLGLDVRKYEQASRVTEDVLTSFTPTSHLPDAERFAACAPVLANCHACGVCSALVLPPKDALAAVQALACPRCQAPLLGAVNAGSCFAKLSTALTLALRQRLGAYYQGWVVCDDSECGYRTRQLSCAADRCLAPKCRGRLVPECSERATHTQLKYLDALFDPDRAKAPHDSDEREILELLQLQVRSLLDHSAFNYIHPSIFNIFQRKPAGKPAAVQA